MTDWWYSEKSKKIGPVRMEDLARLFQSGKIDLKTMVWQEGMSEWQPLEDVEELNTLKATLPPPLPLKAMPNILNYPLGNRWPRFFARILDVWWETLAVSYALGYTLGRYSAGFVEWIYVPGAGQLFGLLCLPIALILDALLYRVIGNTPGKAILGLKVTTLDGKSLGFAQYLSRNFSLWVSGLAFGLPLINFFTLANQSSRLGKGKQASYDEPAGFRVRDKSSGWLRKVVFSVAFFGLFVVMALLYSMEQAARREAILSIMQTNYTWENPLTKMSAEIDSKWKHSSQLNEDGQEIYMFSERADRAVVILAVEHTPGYTLDDYVRAFQKSNAADIRFSDGGRFFNKNGHNSWQGNGSMVDSGTNRLSVQITQYNSAFWRVVTIQVMPYDYSDSLVKQLNSSLWSTVK